METAINLELDNAEWRVDFMLRERDWGQLDPLSHHERKELHQSDLDRRKRDGFFFQPPGGESIANVCNRLMNVINELHRNPDRKALIVCHGETMWAFRVLLERMSQSKYRDLDKKRDFKDKIHNTQIIHYTRRDVKTKKLHKKLRYMRSVCPWNEKLSRNKWVEMHELGKKKKSNKDLEKVVRSIPRTFDNSAPTPLPREFSLDTFSIPVEYSPLPFNNRDIENIFNKALEKQEMEENKILIVPKKIEKQYIISVEDVDEEKEKEFQIKLGSSSE